MKDNIANRYRNISGTVLVINDLDYLEIGINQIIDLRMFPDEALNKSMGLREHIALNNLIRDNSEEEAQLIDASSFRTENMLNDEFIKKLAVEVGKHLNIQKQELDIDVIRQIVSEVAKEFNSKQAIDLSVLENFLKKQDISNEYEDNITNETINRIQEALNTKYSVKQSTVVSEEIIDDDTSDDLKEILSKKGD